MKFTHPSTPDRKTYHLDSPEFRNCTADIAEHEADDDYAYRNGRATDMLKRWPDPGRSAWCLGTPQDELLDRAGRLARFERRVARPLIWFILLASFAIIGLNVRQQLHEAHAAAPPAIRDSGRATMLCKNDWRERCLVCTHLNAFGERTVSTHC